MTASPTHALRPSGLMTTLADHAVTLNWRRVMMRWIAVVQLLYAVWLILPSAGRTIPFLVERDFGIPSFVFVLLFLYGLGHYLRGLRPRYSLITSFAGQGLYAAFTLYYALRGEASMTVLASHGGTFLVCFLAVLSITQDTHHPPLNYSRPWWTVRLHHLLMPAMSTTLALYALGIGVQPDVAVAGWIAQSVGVIPLMVLNIWLAAGSGYIFHNHIKASGLYLALVSHYVYTLAAIAFFLTTPSVSLVAIGSHVTFAMTSFFVILMQTQERH